MKHDEVCSPTRSHVDYLTISTVSGDGAVFEVASEVLPGLERVAAGKSKFYYSRDLLKFEGMQVGVLDYNSVNDNGTAVLSLSGQGTAKVSDWSTAKDFLEGLTRSRLTRCDLAFDTFYGEVTYDKVFRSYQRGGFKSPKSPINPRNETIASAMGDGRNLGRTFYVGDGAQAKSARCYEKGLQMLGKKPARMIEQLPEIYHQLLGSSYEGGPDGAKLEDRFRVEVQFRNAGTVIDFDIVTNPDSYFAGAYPFCSKLMKTVAPRKPKFTPNAAQMCAVHLVNSLSVSYGSLIEDLCRAGYTPDEIIAMARNGKPNGRLQNLGGVRALLDNVRRRGAVN